MIRICVLIASAMALLSTGCAVAPVASDRSLWNSDFSKRSPPTEQCAGGTVSALRHRMSVDGPFDKRSLGQRLPELAPAWLGPADDIHSFQFYADPGSGETWGFSGSLIARADCITYVGKLGYDN